MSHGLRRPAGCLAPRVQLMSAWTEGPSLSSGKQEGGLEEEDRRRDPLQIKTGGPVGPQRKLMKSAQIRPPSPLSGHILAGVRGGSSHIPELPNTANTADTSPGPLQACTYLMCSPYEHSGSLASFYRPKRRRLPKPHGQRIAQDSNPALCDYGDLSGATGDLGLYNLLGGSHQESLG